MTEQPHQSALSLLLLLMGTVQLLAASPNTGREVIPGFLENRGQVVDSEGEHRSDVLFTTRSRGVKVFISDRGLYYQFRQEERAKVSWHSPLPTMDPGKESRTTYRIDVELVGANPDPEVIRKAPTGYYENYYLAHCPEGITGVKSYEKVILKDVYPGIDWVLYRKGEFMKYDFLVHRKADPSRIRMRFDGAKGMKLLKNGDLKVKTPLGILTEKAPITHTTRGEPITSEFRLEGNVLSFSMKGHQGKALRIDPALEWSTYYGGTGGERINDITLDKEGNVYMAGITWSQSGIASGGYQNSLNGGNGDCYLVKFSGSGDRLWATYYGGNDDDDGNGVTTDEGGNVYLCGTTNSNSSIASEGHQNTMPGPRAAFLVKFKGTGVRDWATYYGGNGYERGYSCTADGKGKVLLSGTTTSTTNIFLNGHKDTLSSALDAFLVKFDTSGVREWGTYFGGDSLEYENTCVTDPIGNILLEGSTYSDSGIAFNGHRDSLIGEDERFLARFSSAGDLQWSTYSSGASSGGSCSVDDSGNVFVCSAIDNYGDWDAYLARFDSSGGKDWSLTYGGNFEEDGHDCSAKNGKIYLTGETYSLNGIATSDAYEDSLDGYNPNNSDPFLAVFDKSGDRIWGTYHKGSIAFACVADDSGHVYMGFTTYDIGTAHNGHQNTYGGNRDAYLVKFDMNEVASIGKVPSTSQSTLQLFPNPADQQVRIPIPRNEGSFEMQLYDLTGKRQKRTSIDPLDPYVQVSDLTPGLYLLEMTGKKGERFMGRLVVE